MSEAPLIQLEGITKTFGTGPAAFQALKGVNLAIDRGDFVAIMGPSGSGKSTRAKEILSAHLQSARAGGLLPQRRQTPLRRWMLMRFPKNY